MSKDGKKVRMDAGVLKELHMLKAEMGIGSVNDLIDIILTWTNLYQDNKLDGSFDTYSIFHRDTSKEEKLNRISKELDRREEYMRAHRKLLRESEGD